MAVDWLRIRNEYINGAGSYRKLAELHGVSFSVLKDKAVKEHWADAKKEHANKLRTATEQKTVEKISDALSDEASAKVRIRTKLIQLAENWVSEREQISDTNDFRRIVQSCVDLGVMDAQEDDALDNDGLLEALAANAEAIFDDNDDSDMLPGVV